MKTVKDLLLALVNATLILLALCLFLLWQLSGTVERVTSEFARNLDVLAPVSARLEELNQEVAALRSDLGTVQTEGVVSKRLQSIQLETKRLQEVMTQIANTPEHLMKSSVDHVAQSATDVLFSLRGCQAPDA